METAADTPNTVLLKEITPCNLLSFGPDTEPIRLGALNVLIGANASGKSNFIETIALIRATARDIRKVISDGGGVGEWIWKGAAGARASLEATWAYPRGVDDLYHRILIENRNGLVHWAGETIDYKTFVDGTEGSVIYHSDAYRAEIRREGQIQRLNSKQVDLETSVLTQRRDPDLYPEITYLADLYPLVRIYRELSFGRNASVRNAQSAALRTDRLEEDLSNLRSFLSWLRLRPPVKQKMVEALKDLYEGFSDFEMPARGGTLELFFIEEDFSIPATRLSDGTLRYLCLLAILCDPAPPPLVCIEEPELGLHPDMLPKIADLLVDASERTQLIVTTHSDVLVDALSEIPESVHICEKHDGQTRIERLDAEKLAVWLEKYRLGQLWTSGQLGGTRW